MRKTALLALTILLSGCSGLGKIVSDTVSLPGENPNAPKGDSETFRKVRGENSQILPLLAEPGNIWPGAPPPMPSLRDVMKGTLEESAQGSSDYYQALSGHGATGAGEPLPEGSALSVGETARIHHGVEVPRAAPAPSSSTDAPLSAAPVSGRASRAGGDRADIVIPNGDGTSTVIGSDGSVSTRQDGTKP